MATFKVSMLFNLGPNGWSESWYWNTDNTSFLRTSPITIGSPPIDAIPGLAPWYTVARARVNLLCTEGVLQALRVSDVTQPRSGLLDESVQSLTPASPQERDVKRRSLVCTAQAGEQSAYRRPAELRGIPDSRALLSGIGRPLLERINDDFVTYRTALKNASAALKVLTKDIPAGTNPEAFILKVESPGDGSQFVFTTAGAHGFVDGDSVRIRRVRTVDSPTAPQLNGVWTVQRYSLNAYDPNVSFTIPFVKLSSFAGFRYVGGGLVQKRFYSYPLMTSFLQDRWASHRTGAAFFAGRGRSRARAIRQ